MALFSLFSIPLLLMAQISPVFAIPNVRAIQTGRGDCSAYPNLYSTDGRSADAFIFLPDQADNKSINGLNTGILDKTLVAYDNNTVASTIFCCVNVTILDGFVEQTLLLSTNPNDARLRYSTEGVKPETYMHIVDDVKQEGVFLGSANVTTWAFRRSRGDPGYWQIRLVVPGSGDPTQENLFGGEFKGFLKAVLP